MTNQEFTCWINGYFQLENNSKTLTERQLDIIKNHLNLTKTVDGFLTEKNESLHQALTQLFETQCVSEKNRDELTKLCKMI